MLDAIKTFVGREFSAIWNLIRQIVELKQDATMPQIIKFSLEYPNLFLISTHPASLQWTAVPVSIRVTRLAIPCHDVVRVT